MDVVGGVETRRSVAEELRETGIVRLDGAFSAADGAAIRETVWRYVEARTGIVRDGESTWSSPVRISYKGLKGRRVFAPVVANPTVECALDAVFGPGGWQPPRRAGARILLTMPSPGPWIAPEGWHMDCGFERPTWPLQAVGLWSFFDDVEPEGGGTLLLAGSHRLVERYARTLPRGTGGNSTTWGRFMKKDPWLREVCRGGTAEAPRRDLIGLRGEVDGIPVEIVELTGRPGDVVLTHMHLFHSASPCVGPRPRQMLSGGIRATDQSVL
jgi:hypothetical protein